MTGTLSISTSRCGHSAPHLIPPSAFTTTLEARDSVSTRFWTTPFVKNTFTEGTRFPSTVTKLPPETALMTVSAANAGTASTATTTTTRKSARTMREVRIYGPP